MADKSVSDILDLLCSHVKLERDRGLQALEGKLKDTSNFTSDIQQVEDLQNSLIELVTSTDGAWETRHGGLTGSKTFILNNLGSDDFCENLRKKALKLMHDEEARVRIASGEIRIKANFTEVRSTIVANQTKNIGIAPSQIYQIVLLEVLWRDQISSESLKCPLWLQPICENACVGD